MNSSYCFTVSICEFDFDPAVHVVLNENDWRKNWQGLDMFGCLECSSLNRNKHWFFLYFLFFTVGRASSDTCWICGLTVILKDLKSKGQMTPYIPFRAQIACAMLTEQKVQDHLQLRDLLGDRSWWLFLLLVFCGHILWTHHIFQFLHLVILSFFPLPTWWERIHFNIGSFKDLFEFTFIRLFPTNRYRETATCNFLYMMPEDADYILSLRGLPWVLTEHCFNTCCCSCCI